MDRKYLIILVLRIALGILFLYSGIDKWLSNFDASGYLQHATYGPFKEIYLDMAGNSFVNFLVVVGEIGIGLGILTGTLVRFSSLCGMLMMFMFYFSTFPPEHGLINDQFIYALCFAILSVFGAGRIFGLDKYIEKLPFVQKHWRVFRIVLG